MNGSGTAKSAHVAVLKNLGDLHAGQGKNDEAIECYRQALRLDPVLPEVLNDLGTLLLEGGRGDEAIGCYAEALRHRPAYPDALNNLGTALHGDGRLDEAVRCYRFALSLEPSRPEIHYNLANALEELGRFDEAVCGYVEARRLRPDYAKAHWNEALLRLLRGEFAAGWSQYEWRWAVGGPHGHPLPLWDGSALDGRTILLHCEQGFGDGIQFIRYARMVKARGATVVVACPRPLERLFGTVAGIDRVATNTGHIPACDCQAPLLSLPLLFGTDLATIPGDTPYVHPEPGAVAAWRRRLGGLPGIKVGLVWRGTATHRNDRNRSIAPEALATLLETPGCTFVGLQKEAKAGDEAAFAGLGHFIDVADDLRDFADAAAAVANLDVVISVDTAMAHLAGALGRAAWVLLPFVPDWRWLLERADSPWYPSARLFRQPARGDWQTVITQASRELHKFGGLPPALAPNPIPIRQ